jgi:hypothetical protein
MKARHRSSIAPAERDRPLAAADVVGQRAEQRTRDQHYEAAATPTSIDSDIGSPSVWIA